MMESVGTPRVRRLTMGCARAWLFKRAADGTRLHRGDMVCVCAQCRAISALSRWRMAGVCPACGAADTIPWVSRARRAAAPGLPVSFARRGLGFGSRLMISAAAALCGIWLLACAVEAATRPPWRVNEEGYLVYKTGDAVATRGVVTVSGANYSLRDGRLTPMKAGLARLGGISYYLDADGRVAQGLRVAGERLIYSTREGVYGAAQYIDFSGAGFYALPSLGIRYVDDDMMLPSGVIALPGGLYRLSCGAPVPGDAGLDVLEGGVFDETGLYLPTAYGLTHAGDGIYCVDMSGALRTGFQPLDGSMYYFSPDDYSLSEPEYMAGKLCAGGAFAPMASRLIECGGASYFVYAHTGRLHTGWRTDGIFLYRHDENGVMRVGQPCAQPLGRFDVSGCFIPARAGEMQTEDGFVYYLNAKGVLQTGYVYDNGAVTLYDADTYVRAANRRLTENCHIGADGALRGNGLTVLGDRAYCLTPEGRAETGWQLLNGRLYFFSPDDACRFIGRVYEQGVEYNINPVSGCLEPPEEGVYTLGGVRYAVSASGEARRVENE